MIGSPNIPGVASELSENFGVLSDFWEFRGGGNSGTREMSHQIRGVSQGNGGWERQRRALFCLFVTGSPVLNGLGDSVGLGYGASGVSEFVGFRVSGNSAVFWCAGASYCAPFQFYQYKALIALYT